ncbi:MAG: hypothetical protein EAZ99_04075 [Alphaproteobacteria bacterium]|nr:MAG: hypothetical protein EAZ99_04075 [Alphaproteobacteria bacterium]
MKIHLPILKSSTGWTKVLVADRERVVRAIRLDRDPDHMRIIHWQLRGTKVCIQYFRQPLLADFAVEVSPGDELWLRSSGDTVIELEV